MVDAGDALAVLLGTKDGAVGIHCSDNAKRQMTFRYYKDNGMFRLNVPNDIPAVQWARANHSGAVLVSRTAFERVFDGMERAVRHGSTFGGNDLAAAAALATLRVLEREDLIARAERLGALLLELTAPLVERYEVVRDVRGLGLMWAIEFGPPAGRTRRSLWDAVERRQSGLFAQLITVPLFHEHRILCQVAGHRTNTIKALPALVVEESEIRRFAAALEETIAAAQRYPSSLVRFGLRTSLRAISARR